MNILGIGGYSHDSAAALVCDGKLVAGVAEERLTRVKHQGGVPRRAVRYCLDAAGLAPGDIDHAGCYMRPFKRLARRLPYRLRQCVRSPLYSAGYIGYELLHNARYVYGMRRLFAGSGASTGNGLELHFMDHHQAHAAAAFLVSPFDSAALLTIDYIGEWIATWAGVGKGITITQRHVKHYPHSLGVLYSAITDYLGFRRASDEYKVMGLAAYGEPEFYDAFRRIVRSRSDGWYDIDLSWMRCHYQPGSMKGYFSDKFLERFGPKRNQGEPVEQRHKNIAASAQRVLEDVVLDILEKLHADTGEKNLCMAGGVALNCAMNGRMLRESPFDDIYVQPAAGDDGIAIGAAFQLYHQITGADRGFVMEDARIGPEFSDSQIRGFLENAKIDYETPEYLEGYTARLIAGGNIVGWFQGRAEFGPRALGARSILADPTRADMKDLLNRHVKNREDFRPFAPSVLEDRAAEYFTGCRTSPFMLFVYPVEQDKRDMVPAITHVDGTARVQTVSNAINPRYYRLIKAFEKIRGVPLVLNTSFNVMGEPIVNTPADAVKCFYTTGMDALVMGNHVVRKRP